MDLDEIQSVQSRERQTDSLQQLRDSFYEEAGEFVRALREEREQAAERAEDPFDAPEVTRLSDDIATAEQTLEAIYERRVGKIVKMASLAAADMPTEDEGLTTEERDLFESLVGSIEDSREHVFDVLEGETTDARPKTNTEANSSVDTGHNPAEDDDQNPPVPEATSPTADRSMEDQHSEVTEESEPEEISAADLMGAEREPPTAESNAESATDEPGDARAVPDDEPIEATVGEPTRGDGGGPAAESASDVSTEPAESPGAVSTGSNASVERATLRITDDVGEILGVDDRAYELTTDDIVTLPETNAGPLLEQDAAERLE